MASSPTSSTIKEPLKRVLLSLIQPVTSAEWSDPSHASKPFTIQRLTYILNNEEVTVRLEYPEGGDQMKVELFSLEYGVYGGIFRHNNLPEVLAEIKGGILHFDEGNNQKVIMGVGPHGLTPVELIKLPSPTVETKTLTLEEEVRRLRYHLFELHDSYNELRTKYDDLEAKFSIFVRGGVDEKPAE